MDVGEGQRRLLELCAVTVDGVGADWSVLARQAQCEGGLEDLGQAVIWERSAAARRSLRPLLAPAGERARAAERVDAALAAAAAAGARLVTVLDADYPQRLRHIWELPAFLFYRGELPDSGARSVAVVGTRQPSAAGARAAALMARRLGGLGHVIVSGLAAGIDAAAHRAALEVGVPTVGVLGTGIARCYPEVNRGLSEEIASGGGALVSRFWPTQPPSSQTFPLRNVVTSGLCLGTVVIEAGPRSGARLQARIALEQGRQVFLLASLVARQEWAASYVAQRGAIAVASADDVAARLRESAAPPAAVARPDRPDQQLTLNFT